MATATAPAKTTPAPKAETPAKAENAEGEKKEKRATANLDIFEVVKEVPKNPTSLGTRGRGKVWEGKFQAMLDKVKPGQWVKVAEYTNGQGATNVKHSFEVEEDHKSYRATPSKNNDGQAITWLFEARRFIDGKDEEGKDVVKSALFMQYSINAED